MGSNSGVAELLENLSSLTAPPVPQSWAPLPQSTAVGLRLGFVGDEFGVVAEGIG